MIGEPFSIETTSQFDKATLTYVIDKSKLGDTEFDNLLFLWYDEENDNFVELDTILDEENSTVSVETTHFSKYMIVDGKEWYRAWQNIYTKINESKGQHIPNALFGGDSGAQQYNLLGQEKAEWFYSKRKIQGDVFLKVSIMNNILTYNDKSVTMKRKIIDYIVMSEYLIILEDFTGDDYNLVYCFDNELHKLWKIKKPDSKFIGQKQLPYVGITITKGLTVVDTLGRYLIIDMDTGEITDMFCNRF